MKKSVHLLFFISHGEREKNYRFEMIKIFKVKQGERTYLGFENYLWRK